MRAEREHPEKTMTLKSPKQSPKQRTKQRARQRTKMRMPRVPVMRSTELMMVCFPLTRSLNLVVVESESRAIQRLTCSLEPAKDAK